MGPASVDRAGQGNAGGKCPARLQDLDADGYQRHENKLQENTGYKLCRSPVQHHFQNVLGGFLLSLTTMMAAVPPCHPTANLLNATKVPMPAR